MWFFGIKKKKTKELQNVKYALRRLLNCFYNRDKWPAISVAVEPKLWFHGGKIDDTTREAIRYAEKVLGDDVS